MASSKLAQEQFVYKERIDLVDNYPHSTMKFSILTVIAFTAVSTFAHPLHDGFDNPQPKYIIADISKQEYNFTESPFVKRDVESVTTPLINQINYYQLEMTVGNPPQRMSALLDTGSSDLWFFGTNSGQRDITTFDAGKSQTYHNNHTNFQINYVSGSARGTWGTDDITIGGAKLAGQSFAVVNQGNGLSGLPGLVGVGMPSLESTNQGFGLRSVYNNVPASLYAQGYIESPTFSLYLNSVDAQQGSVLFGALDHSRYQGQLYTVPRTSNSRYNIALDSISVGGSQYRGSTTTLDSGTTLGSLPDNICSGLADELGLTLNYQYGAYVTYPGSYDPETQVVFTFSGVQFPVRLEDLLIDSEKLGPPLPSGLKIFAFGPSSQTGNQVIFGDIFLRNFYVVYDMNNKNIGLALADFTGRAPQIEAISADATNFPGAVVAAPNMQAAPINASPAASANRNQNQNQNQSVASDLLTWIQRNNPFANLFGGGNNARNSRNRGQ